MAKQQVKRVSGAVDDSLCEQLRLLGELGSRLAAAADPLVALEAALPEIAAQLDGVTAAHLAAVLHPESATTAGHGADGDLLRAVSGLARLAHANAALRARLVEQLRLGVGLDMAAELQQSFQPDCVPGHQPIWGVNLPARKVSGDFFDFYRLDEQRIAFALGDVSGKGMNAALLMAKTISLFRCLSKRIDTPSELLAAINAELCETASRGMFVTMVAGHYWTASGTVNLANAGHQPPLLRRQDRSYASFPAAAPPLGIMPSTLPPDEQIKLEGGELYIFTDGLTEYRYISGEQLGVQGLIQLIEALAEAPLAKRLEALLKTLDQDADWEARDDLTVLAIDDAWVRGVAGDEAGGLAGQKAEAGT